MGPGDRQRGHAALADETADYDLRALSTERPAFYERLGWKCWQGPLGVRREGQVIATPGETVLILPTPRTPPIHLDSPLTAEWRGGQPW